MSAYLIVLAVRECSVDELRLYREAKCLHCQGNPDSANPWGIMRKYDYDKYKLIMSKTVIQLVMSQDSWLHRTVGDVKHCQIVNFRIIIVIRIFFLFLSIIIHFYKQLLRSSFLFRNLSNIFLTEKKLHRWQSALKTVILCLSFSQYVPLPTWTRKGGRVGDIDLLPVSACHSDLAPSLSLILRIVYRYVL